MIAGPSPERAIRTRDAAARTDLTVFADRARVLDEAAVLRLRGRSDGLLGVWVLTGFDVLAGRAVAGSVRPADITCAAGQFAENLRASDVAGIVDPGFPMDSAWRGALPPETGFVHLDDVPAVAIVELARQGAELSGRSGGLGSPSGHSGGLRPARSLLDQDVLQVSSQTDAVAVPMRCAMALTAMRFIPEDPSSSEIVRVRVSPTWLRVDARYGSVFRRRAQTGLALA